ncbi:DUF2599 domain-containing protein [Pseudomonas sp. DWP3-1-2]|uniref:DUF2599 domain-containing protein n=1 Tax=Pseudomonas sp. DWP3-1-2 TaxID=2804645 RepID=UPI003CFBBF8D
MNTTTLSATLTACLGLVFISPLSIADSGSETAALMTHYYNDTRPYCQSTSAPAFMCSGIMLRATVPASTYHSWNPSPRSVSNGGVSFSYLRADASFSKLAYGHNNGFTLFPYNYASKNAIQPEVLCAFPIDAITNQRINQGCGDSLLTNEIEDYCQTQGIINAESWRDAFVVANQNRSRQCAFDVHDNLNTKGAASFFEMIRATGLSETQPSSTQNELRLATWEQNQPLPIQSFFYTADGLADAQADQIDWFNTNGAYVPVIALTLPSEAAQTQFTYHPEDQAVCENYIDRAAWVRRPDSHLKRDVWTLEVTPTQCGRKIQENQTKAAYAELEKKFSAAPEWNEENGGAMQGQLMCHLVLSRNKPTWDLEPFRPNASPQEFLDADCNPTLAASASAEATIGTETAKAMTAYYNDIRSNCGASSAPAFLCSGVIMRATVPSTSYHSWNPSPASKASGGVSFSYLRADAKFSRLAFGLKNGFTFFPYSVAPVDSVKPEVLCAYPFDAGTGSRTNQGCGDHSRTEEIENYCHESNITTAESWRDNFVANNNGFWKQCAFDVRDARNVEGAKGFYESLKARNLLPDIAVKEHNELRLKTWSDNIPDKLPIQSFFYFGDGLTGAQADQIDWFKTTGKFLPIIEIQPPALLSDEVRFLFNEKDQAVCARCQQPM